MQPILSYLLHGSNNFRKDIESLISKNANRPTIERHTFNYSMAIVVIDFQAGEVLIEDRLSNEAFRMPLSDMIDILKLPMR